MLKETLKTDVFAQFFEAAPDALFLVDSRGLVVECNTQVERMFGYSREEIIDCEIEMLLPMASRDIHIRHRLGFAKKPSLRKMGAELNLYGCRKNGEEFPIDVSLSPINLGGQIMTAAAVRDFTQQRSIETELRNATKQAQAATTSKSRFLAAASHDLRQPLQSLNLYLAVLKKQATDPVALDTAGKMHLALDAMGDMLNALLDLSRFDGDSMKPEFAEFPVQAVLNQIQADNAPIAEEKELKLDLPRCNSIIRSDQRLLQRVVGNFVTNAINYTEKGTVTVSCREANGSVLIEVIDTGIGIESDQLDFIFEEYVQVGNEGRDRRKGLGLGLTIANNIARLLGHPISVQSQPGIGSSFSVSVAMGSAQKKPKQGVYREPEKPPKKRLVILLVEDEPAVLDATALLLETEGHEVFKHSDSEGALALIKTGLRPSLIISDYRLPGIDGLTVIRLIREHFGSELPAILMTGDTTVPELSEGNCAGCATLFKPIDADELMALVEKLQV